MGQDLGPLSSVPGVDMPYDSKAIANFFLDHATDNGMPLDPIKLQRLVYFAHGWHLALTGNPLLGEQVQAWSFGPVICSLYEEFRQFGTDPITRKAIDIRPGMHIRDPIRDREPSIDDYATENNVFTTSLLQRVWDVYSKFTPIQLSNMTHAPETPWSQVKEYYNGRLPEYATIPDEYIKEYFRGRVGKSG